MGLLEQYLAGERAKMMRYGIRLVSIGDRSRLPASVKAALEETIELTRANQRMTVILALSYSGRDEIVRMAKRLAREARDRRLDPEEIDERVVASHLDSGEVPDPDLLIRTSGEMRISNFLLWQIAYAEIYVTETFWPDFRRGDLLEAIVAYQKRDRRYGGIAPPVAAGVK
jgi:undecaprenyl diphosphate synthase